MRRRLLTIGMLVSLATLAAPATTHAATCSDFTNQAAAQRAANTRDGDGDGIYCESLPCPCSKAKGKSPAHSNPAPVRRPPLGRTILLGPVRKHSGCEVRGPLPDPDCTPGTRFSRVTKRQVCRPGFAGSVRNVRDSTAAAVYAAYGLLRRFDGSNGELDHLVSLELGGTNARANLFPESAATSPGAKEKDLLENRLHKEVCAGTITLRRAQQLIARDWVAAYRARFTAGAERAS